MVIFLYNLYFFVWTCLHCFALTPINSVIKGFVHFYIDNVAADKRAYPHYIVSQENMLWLPIRSTLLRHF